MVAMIILYITLGCLVGWWVLWVLFLAVMHLKHTHEDGLLTPSAYRLAMSVLAVGYLVDFLINIIPASILFLEPPFELTVTARCTRHLKDHDFRGAIARWLCRNLLDPMQEGGSHCQ